MAPYPLPTGTHPVPTNLLDLRSDSEIDHDLQTPKPVGDNEKNVWFFWHQGYSRMHPYTKRNIRAWHRRFSKKGWVIRVLDRVPESPLNVENFLDVQDPETFPQSFRDGTIGGDYAPQHTSDLVRWPLLLKYGGIYADVGLLQIGDIDRLWNETMADPDSPYEVFSNNGGGPSEYALMNYLLCSRRNSPLFARCQKLFMALWEGKSSTDGMRLSPLLKGVPLMEAGSELSFTENGVYYGPKEVNEMLTDYIIQGHVMTMVMGLVDEEDGWNGPEYTAKHVYAIEYMVGSQLINEYTGWNGQRAFDLLSLRLPKSGQVETEDQKRAREIVEGCLSRSFSFKLAHGFIIKVMGETLGSLWRKHEGSDDVEETYAHWLRYGMVHWEQDELPTPQRYEVIKPFKVGPLLRAI